jgi:signal transduction histidine kinase
MTPLARSQRSLARATWSISFLLLGGLATFLLITERELAQRVDGALETERVHVAHAQDVQDHAGRAYTALLERWVTGTGQASDRSRLLLDQLEELRHSALRLEQLSPLSEAESSARSELLVALALFGNRLNSAIVNEDAPAAIAELGPLKQTIEQATQQLLMVDTEEGRKSDVVLGELRQKSSFAIQGLIGTGAAALLLALAWWRRSRSAQRCLEVAEASRRENQRAAALRSRFFAHVSHELRTPIVTIQTQTEKLTSPEVEMVRRRIRQAADELLHGINNVLDASKVDHGQLALRREEVDLERVIRRSVHRCEGLIGEKLVKTVINIEPGLPPVCADEVKCHQIFTNLLANAIKFTTEGTITVSARREGEERVYAEVKDTGIGIADDAKERIWEPFVQADETISRQYGGTGLGLSLVRTLVTLQHGEVGVISHQHRGACFWLKLPIHRKGGSA